jgi:hypothetical protein
MARLELVPLSQQEDLDFLAEDKIVRNTAEPTRKCFAALERICERKLWRGRFASFDNYCRQRIGHTGSYMRKKINVDKFNRSHICPTGQKLELNERQHRALIGFRSEYQTEILERSVQEAGSVEKLTAPIIERVGRAVQDERQPRQTVIIPNEVEEEDEEEEQQEAVQNDEINRRVAEKVTPPPVHVLVREYEHVRIGRKKGNKTVAEDLEDAALLEVQQKLLSAYLSGLKFHLKLLIEAGKTELVQAFNARLAKEQKGWTRLAKKPVA